jgi:ribosomal protein S18 acetylase RimI-like enzyme
MSEQTSLEIKECVTDAEIQSIYNFNTNAFADMQDFEWNTEELKSQIAAGWTLLSVSVDKDIVAAIFIKIVDKTLYTKNTAIKMEYQGNGFSHLIKEFYEELAAEKAIDKIINYCAQDNFRMISLNEGHNYVKTGNNTTANIIEWEKAI